MSFNIEYVGGGVLDKVRSITRLESGRTDDMFTHPHPFAFGGQFELPNEVVGAKQAVTFNCDVEVVTVGVEANRYAEAQDQWQLTIDTSTHFVFGNDFVKTPEGLSLQGSRAIPAGTPLTFRFLNLSGTSKLVWYYFLVLASEEKVERTLHEVEYVPGIRRGFYGW